MENTLVMEGRGVRVNVRKDTLFKRIACRLAVNNQQIHASKSKESFETLGNFYIVADKAIIAETHVDPVELARRIGALRPFEDALGF